MENYFLLENYITSEGVVSHNVLYYQQLPITRYQVRVMLIIILGAFKGDKIPVFLKPDLVCTFKIPLMFPRALTAFATTYYKYTSRK